MRGRASQNTSARSGTVLHSTDARKKMFRTKPPTYVPELRRQVWGGLFGLFIEGRRNELNMPVAEAAGLSGMEISEWSWSGLQIGSQDR